MNGIEERAICVFSPTWNDLSTARIEDVEFADKRSKLGREGNPPLDCRFVEDKGKNCISVQTSSGNASATRF